MFRPLLLTLVLSALSGPALAGPPSSLVNASFIDGAEIVTNTPALAQFAASLRQVAANVNGQCKQSEYVVWPSRDGLETQFRQGLESLNYRFGVLTTDNENGYVMAFQAKGAQTTLVGLWVDVDGTTVLGWCSLAALAANTGATSTTPATWPAFGTFQVGDTVQFYTSIGWKQGIIKEVGPGPGQPAGDRWHAVKKYLIRRTDINSDGWEEWGSVAHLKSAPYWTGFFVGDWKLGEMMAVNTSVSGSTETTTFSYMTASDALRVNADGTYEWKSSFAATVKGRWTPAPDGPGIVVKDSKGRTWTLRNETNETTERIRKLESARLYPSDRSEMSQVATRPLKR